MQNPAFDDAPTTEPRLYVLPQRRKRLSRVVAFLDRLFFALAANAACSDDQFDYWRYVGEDETDDRRPLRKSR